MATAIEGAPYKSGDLLAERYEVKDVRGAGPLGFVFRAHDRELDLEVALKVISKRLIQTDEEREHFSRVIRTGRRLSHQNLARVNEDGLSDDAPFYTSQFLEGLTLRKILEHRVAKNQVFTLHEVEPILTQIAIALQASHRLGPHSDLKPENVIVLPDLLKVTDFGMGMALPRAPFVAALKGRKGDRYLAPEWHKEGATIDARSDTYALGVILGEMLAHVTPEGSGIPELHRLRPDLPAAVDGLYRKALSDTPGGRFQTPAELMNELSAIIKRMPARAHKGAPPPEVPARQAASKLQEEPPPVPERFIPSPPPPAPAHSNGSSAGGYSKAVRSGNAVIGGAAAMNYAPTDGPTLPPDAPSNPRPNGGPARPPSDHSLDETQPFDVSMLPPEISGLLSDQTQPFDASMLPSLPPPRELAQRLRAGLPPTQGPDDPGSSPTPRIDPRGHAAPSGRSTLPIDEAPPWNPPDSATPVSVTPTDGFQTVDDPQAGPFYRVGSDNASTMAMDESQLDEVLNPRPLFGAVAPRPAERPRSNAMLWLALLIAGGVVVGSLGGYLVLSGMRRRPADLPPQSQGSADKSAAAAAAAAAVAAAPALKCPEGMVGIVKGAFKMGTAKDDPMMGFDERALGAVDVEAFCVDEYEYPNRKGEQPIVNVSWSDAKKQCEKKGKRLCSEQEWEKACKGRQSFRFPYGDVFDPNACNTEKKGGDDREISGAGMFPLCASAYGVKDLSGNVAEWTDTQFAGHSDRTQKGGSFDRPDYAARCSARRSGASSAKTPEVGFRCCASPL
ncbi:MAG TPA: SUMF1/EgtB/PvdO family nonheme iron enzyme [Myxococcales bacterium]|nr:SUMF1/EgtB/PvdO family nonheme iron enzyme [Myxococcales bacterium]